jgi:dUTP pyrophosphatase
MQIKVKRLSPYAVLPYKAHDSDAGFDLTAISRKTDKNENIVYGTGLAFEIPENHVGLIFPRSSNATTDLRLTNCVGVLDSGYRGEVLFKFRPTALPTKIYAVGDRIGQLIVIPYPKVEFIESN